MGARQINGNLYVGQSDLSTIQKAVTFAAKGGSFAVIVPQGYTGSDLINAVTGGNASVYISDQRNALYQNYVWSGSAYVPAAFVQLGGYAADFAGGNPTIPMDGNLLLDGVFACIANSFGGAGSAQEGFALTCNVSNGNSETDFINATNVAEAAGGYHWYNGVAPYSVDENTVPIMALDGDGNLGIRTSLTAPVANFNSCFVNGLDPSLNRNVSYRHDLSRAGSVRLGRRWVGASIDPATLALLDADGNLAIPGNISAANYPPPSSMVYPAAGIGVSTGAAWGTSIDPATLQGKLTLTTTGSSGPATLVGSTLNVPQYAGIPMVYPAVGIGVSTGAAWGTSIDPATLARLNAANTFTGNQTVTGNLSVSGTGVIGNIFFGTLGSAYGGSPYMITNGNDYAVSAGPGGNLILNYFASGGTAGIQFGNGNRGVAGGIDADGDLSANGTIRSQSSISAFGSTPLKMQ